MRNSSLHIPKVPADISVMLATFVCFAFGDSYLAASKVEELVCKGRMARFGGQDRRRWARGPAEALVCTSVGAARPSGCAVPRSERKAGKRRVRRVPRPPGGAGARPRIALSFNIAAAIFGAWRRPRRRRQTPGVQPLRQSAPSSITASRSRRSRASARPSPRPSGTRCGPSPSPPVANPRTAKPPASKAVFVNCPFDDEFKPILRAIVFTVIASGYHPRSALDATDGAEIRLGKIAAMIGECDWGIHDLSRVEVEDGGVPRFNMPMELGIHLGARLFGEGRHRRKRALILEAQPHRYDAALSDISGQDIEVHGNDPDQAIRCVRNWLSDHRPRNAVPLPGVAAMQADYRLFRDEIGALLEARRLDPLHELSHSDFMFAVRDWIESRADTH